jgi:hypothetical protein
MGGKLSGGSKVKAPPPLLGCARVMSYAIVPDDIPFTGRDSLFVGGILQGRFPCLAICEQLSDGAVLLLHCDEEWDAIGVAGGDQSANLKDLAEKNYPGISKSWVDVNTSVMDALTYYDENWPQGRCSVCGKRSFEVKTMHEGKSDSICGKCYDAAQSP